jgi:hypothetical protein
VNDCLGYLGCFTARMATQLVFSRADPHPAKVIPRCDVVGIDVVVGLWYNEPVIQSLLNYHLSFIFICDTTPTISIYRNEPSLLGCLASNRY